MKINIDDKDLENLLLKKKDHIGKGVGDIGSIVSGVLFIVSSLGCQFPDFKYLPGVTIKALAILLGAGVAIYGIVTCILRRKRYTYMDLKKDIMQLDKVDSRNSLVALRDHFNDRPMKYLVYYDEKWNCWFFPHFDTRETKDGDAVRQGIAHILGVNERKVKCKKVGEEMHQKLSPKTHVKKMYHHSLYDVKVNNIPENEKAPEFELDGVKYRWMTISDMEKDESIMEVNHDVISFVKGLIR